MTQTPPTPPPKTAPNLHLNWEDWLPYLDDSTATEAEKKLLIETVWSIALAFVDLGWEIDPPKENGGQTLDLSAALRAAVLNSKDTAQQEEDAA